MELLNNKGFVVIKGRNHNIFYNSIRHFACRISDLDLMLFNLIYIHKELDVILSHIEPSFHQYVTNIYRAVCDNEVLSEVPIIRHNELTKQSPSSYYLHLTYKCNLACTYCYNKKIRQDFQELSKGQWKSIIDKILPYATHITLTGGEPTLSEALPYVVAYVKTQKKDVYLEMISNCMTDFEKYPDTDNIFKNIDGVVFSCDNLSDKDQTRVNFSPNLFKNNITFLRNRYPKLSITISSVYSRCNSREICNIRCFCKQACVAFRNVLIVPNDSKDIPLLPDIEEYKLTLDSTITEMESLRFYCGAALGVLSIDPMGNVYPCQSLHEEVYKMGNILYTTIDDILNTDIYHNISKNFSVDTIPVCKECSVRYICGGGCRAATKNTEGSPVAFPQTLCPYYKAKAFNTLQSIPFLKM